MPADYFGSEKTVKTNDQIVTGEFCALSIGGNVALLQSAGASYRRTVQPMFEAGTSTTYYITGNSEGEIRATAAVGKNGFFANFKNLSSNCGKIDKLGFTLRSGGKCSVGSSGSLNFSNGLVTSVGVTLNAGFAAVTNDINILVGFMSVS
jgi:hypothetical protein